MMAATGRLVFRPAEKNAELKRVTWDDSTVWQFWLVIKRIGDDYALLPLLRSGSEEMHFDAATLTTEATVIGPDFRAARFDSRGSRTWVEALRRSGDFKVPAENSRELIAQLVDLPSIPHLEVPT